MAVVSATSSQRVVSELAVRKPIETPRFSTQRRSKKGRISISRRNCSSSGKVTTHLVAWSATKTISARIKP
jgi:hypothetical protein